VPDSLTSASLELDSDGTPVVAWLQHLSQSTFISSAPRVICFARYTGDD